MYPLKNVNYLQLSCNKMLIFSDERDELQIFIYPTGAEIPPDKQTQAGMSSKTTSDQPV